MNLPGVKALLFENLHHKQIIFKNSFWLAVSSGVSRLLKVVLLIYAARILGATDYGKFSFALAFVSLLVVFHDFGLPPIVTREFAKDTKRDEELHSLISLKILLSLAALLITFLALPFVSHDPSVQKAIVILIFFSLINGFATLLYVFFQARQKMEYQTWSEILQALLATVFGLFVLFRFPSIVSLSYTQLAAAIFSFILTLILFQIKFFPLKISWNKEVWKRFMTMSWPLALSGLFGLIYTYIDSVMLGLRGLIEETGWYNAAYRVVFIALLPVGFISGGFFPALSNFFEKSKEKLQETWNLEMEVTILLSMPLLAGGVGLANKIIGSLFSAGFEPSILALQILILMVVFTFLYRPFYDLMIIAGQQKKAFWINLAGGVMNVILNLILIPRYSLYGAAWASVISALTVLVVSMGYVKKFSLVKFLNLRFLAVFLAAALSSGVMYFIAAKTFLYNLNIFILIAISAIIYFALIYVLRSAEKSLRRPKDHEQA